MNLLVCLIILFKTDRCSHPHLCSIHLHDQVNLGLVFNPQEEQNPLQPVDQNPAQFHIQHQQLDIAQLENNVPFRFRFTFDIPMPALLRYCESLASLFFGLGRGEGVGNNEPPPTLTNLRSNSEGELLNSHSYIGIIHERNV